MYTSNNQNVFQFIYNGPHEIRSTYNMSNSITVRNISFEKEYREIKDKDVFQMKSNVQEDEICDNNT